MAKPIIWIEGLIGSGKSRMTEQLRQSLGYRAFQEPVAEGGYLELFYKDPKRWAFSFQVEMLKRRWDLHRLATLEARCGTTEGCILDRGMPGDRVFAWLNYQAGNMHTLEWETYEALYSEFMSIPNLQPTVLLYLDVHPQVALKRIAVRARDGEGAVTEAYLTDLRDAYERLLVQIEGGHHPWASGMRVVRVPWSLDNQPIGPIVAQVQSALPAYRETRRSTPAPIQSRLAL